MNDWSPRTFYDLLRHFHACQVGEHQHPGLQAVGVAERRLLLLDVDVPQLPDQLQQAVGGERVQDTDWPVYPHRP